MVLHGIVKLWHFDDFRGWGSYNVKIMSHDKIPTYRMSQTCIFMSKNILFTCFNGRQRLFCDGNHFKEGNRDHTKGTILHIYAHFDPPMVESWPPRMEIWPQGQNLILMGNWFLTSEGWNSIPWPRFDSFERSNLVVYKIAIPRNPNFAKHSKIYS